MLNPDPLFDVQKQIVHWWGQVLWLYSCWLNDWLREVECLVVVGFGDSCEMFVGTWGECALIWLHCEVL